MARLLRVDSMCLQSLPCKHHCEFADGSAFLVSEPHIVTMMLEAGVGNFPPSTVRHFFGKGSSGKTLPPEVAKYFATAADLGPTVTCTTCVPVGTSRADITMVVDKTLRAVPAMDALVALTPDGRLPGPIATAYALCVLRGVRMVPAPEEVTLFLGDTQVGRWFPAVLADPGHLVLRAVPMLGNANVRVVTVPPVEVALEVTVEPYNCQTASRLRDGQTLSNVLLTHTTEVPGPDTAITAVYVTDAKRDTVLVADGIPDWPGALETPVRLMAPVPGPLNPPVRVLRFGSDSPPVLDYALRLGREAMGRGDVGRGTLRLVGPGALVFEIMSMVTLDVPTS
jgi:hypothetical protein